jgi:uncharacterized protein (TIGR02246 family)
MDVRAKQRLFHHVALFPLACVYSVSPHVISTVMPLRAEIQVSILDRELFDPYIELEGIKLMKQIIIFAVLALTISLSAVAQTSKKMSNNGKVEQAIQQLENEIREALLNNDAKTFERLLADDWMNTNADGTVTTKIQFMELLKSNPFKFTSIEYDDVMVRTYKDTAVVTGRVTTKRTGQDNKTVTRQARFMRVYVKKDRRWQVINAQSTLINQQ